MFKSEAAVVCFCSHLFHLFLLLSVIRCSTSIAATAAADDDHHHRQLFKNTDWHTFTEPMLTNGSTSNLPYKASSSKVLDDDDDDLERITTAWSSPTQTADSFNRGYFHQMNALNHPHHQKPSDNEEEKHSVEFAESQLKPSISSPSSSPSTSPRSNLQKQQQQDNVYYFSPSSYGARTPQTPSTSTQFPKRSTMTNSSSSSSSSGAYSPSRDQILSALSALAASDSRNKSNSYYYSQQQQQSPQWSVPLATESSKNIDPRLDHHNHQNQQQPQQHLPTSSYSNELNKLLLQKYVNRDLASMTALLGRYPPGTTSPQTTDITGRKTGGEAAAAEDAEDGGDAEDGDEDGEVSTTTADVDDTEQTTNALEERPETIQYYARAPESSSKYVNSKGVHPHPSHLEYKAAREPPTTVLRVLPAAASPRHIVRHAYTRLPPPPPPGAIRYQTAHSHAVPHYYMPHGVESGGSSGGGVGGGGHHHLVHDSKHGSSTWLGGGLAAGILIGAIPFGIMMASMMPSLLTTALPIVNTATVAGKRRRRRRSTFASTSNSSSAANELKNLILEQTLDTVGLLLSRGLRDFALGKLGGSFPPLKKQYSTQKNDPIVENSFVDRGTAGSSTSYSTTSSATSNSEELLKVMARYALAAVDEPRCIKEAVCTLVAGGRHPQTLPVQKVAYMMTKW